MRKEHSVWALLMFPGAWILYQYAADIASYGQTIHRSGQWSVALLAMAMSITPLRRIIASRWMAAVARNRRAIGVASFGYAFVHTAVYLEYKWGAGLILSEGLEPEMATGWLALGVFFLLAITSNNLSARFLGAQWKRLHRSIYLAAILTFAHWILSTYNADIAYLCLVALVFIEMLRFSKRPQV
jgi:sulfoxide reductase heme-binding subunit YedZ